MSTRLRWVSLAGCVLSLAAAAAALWFTEYGANNIGRITTDGVVTECLTPTPVLSASDFT